MSILSEQVVTFITEAFISTWKVLTPLIATSTFNLTFVHVCKKLLQLQSKGEAEPKIFSYGTSKRGAVNFGAQWSVPFLSGQGSRKMALKDRSQEGYY